MSSIKDKAVFCIRFPKHWRNQMPEKDDVSLSEKYFNKACSLQAKGNLTEAIEYLKLSIAYNPTAEAYTRLGRIYGYIERYEAAIDQCIRATSLAPDNGDIYNDIGSYYINLGQYDHAVEWLNKALNAPQNEFKFYPLYNLGRISEMKGLWQDAIFCYKEALHLNPAYEEAERSLTRVYSYLN
jgi:tetratricopeptide (TPR) repeat protein